jgi:hypothetical protein
VRGSREPGRGEGAGGDCHAHQAPGRVYGFNGRWGVLQLRQAIWHVASGV